MEKHLNLQEIHVLELLISSEIENLLHLSRTDLL